MVCSLKIQDLVNGNVWEQRQDFAHLLEQAATMLQPVGGMDQIGIAFEAQVTQDIVYEAVVNEIRKTASGVSIIYQVRSGPSQMLDADYCICTIPATVLAGISNDFSVDHQLEIENFEYSSAGKIAFQSRRFWEQDHNIYGGISWTTQDITQIW